MSVLLMRLTGPMQSWGTRSRFSNRDTGMEPSRSGVIGLLCAALGRPREAPLDDFRPLKMAVRVDREGRLMRDYHTAQNVRRADPTKGTQDTVLSERFYLADADFLVALEGDRAFLERLDAALRRPVWTLFLGRKAFVPSLPVSEGVTDGDPHPSSGGPPVAEAPSRRKVTQQAAARHRRSGLRRRRAAAGRAALIYQPGSPFRRPAREGL